MKQKNEKPFTQNIPVVVITGSSQMQDQITAFELGASDFISKPFVPEVVLSRVNNVLSSNKRILSIEQEALMMKSKSETDEMTGLYNKTTTETMMSKLLRNSDQRLMAMAVIDIDNFKTVNDTVGHHAGDHVIKIIANLISGLFRKTDIVGRIGGDEFCVLMVDVPRMDIVYEKINELLQIMRYKSNLSVPEYISLSIGIASNHQEAVSYVQLFQQADEALYQAKQSGKAQYREYGVTPTDITKDERPLAILFSSNRSISSIVNALISSYVQILELSSVEQLMRLDCTIASKVTLLYIDVSDQEDDASSLWKQITSLDWVAMEHTFAICQEGNVKQYLAALTSGAADIFKFPLDREGFKRRTVLELELLAGIDKDH